MVMLIFLLLCMCVYAHGRQQQYNKFWLCNFLAQKNICGFSQVEKLKKNACMFGFSLKYSVDSSLEWIFLLLGQIAIVWYSSFIWLQEVKKDDVHRSEFASWMKDDERWAFALYKVETNKLLCFSATSSQS